MMLYADRHFIQVLEGPEDVVRRLVDRIDEDPRHRDITVLLSETVAQRSFPDWSMGFSDRPDDLDAMPGFTAYLDGLDDDAPLEGHGGIFLRVFRDRMRRGPQPRDGQASQR